ncbi:hypothetical protein V8G54_016806 [Vigna mungo]|uniref:non-specific serine/threonine protein kinase n=1 Tax=Vigna mungo TaxID=3915 RepID=A0AAQ3NNQ1_VIGMU
MEAIENHMPQVMVIDEIGTKHEAMATSTIVQSGIQLICKIVRTNWGNMTMEYSMGDKKICIKGNPNMPRQLVKPRSLPKLMEAESWATGWNLSLVEAGDSARMRSRDSAKQKRERNVMDSENAKQRLRNPKQKESQTLNSSRKLYSNANGSVDYSTGQYSLEIQQSDGNIVLKAYRFTDSAYWWSDTAQNTGVRIIFDNATAFLYAVNATNQIIFNMTTEVVGAIEDYYHRVLVDDKGNFQKLIYHKENGSEWRSVWQAVTKPCTVTALCGVYGFCNTSGSDTQTYSCGCLPGYTPLDPTAPSKGCYLSEVKDLCAANSSASNFEVEVKEIQDADIPNSGYFFLDLQVLDRMDLESCKRELMDDCLCMAAVLDGTACHKKKWPIINAIRIIPDTSNRVMLIKVPLLDNNKDNERDSPSVVVLVVALISCSLLAVLFAATAIYHHPVFIMSLTIFLPCIAALLSLSNLNGLHAIQSNTSITAGSNSTWKSSSSDFEFGFYHLPNGLFLVGIWFGRIPERTLVWYLAPPVEPNSQIQFTSAGQLVVVHPNGTTAQTIYSGGNGGAATSATMQDDGNFVMKNSNLRPVWESFNFPADTILPGQTLQTNHSLYSKGRGPSNYSLGNFMLQMQGDGNLLLKAHQWADPAYWFTSTTTPDVNLLFNATTALMYLVGGGTGNIYSITNTTPTPVEDYYHRAAIDENGNFQQYAYRKRNGSGWSRVWRAVEDPCRVNVVCGVYGLCTSPDNESVKCQCLPGYIPLDDQDVSKGCRPPAVINYCAENNFKLQVFDDTDFHFDTHLVRLAGVDFESCKKDVIDDCNIGAATYSQSTSTCVKKRLPLLNARNSTSSKGLKALLKVAERDESGTPEVSKKKSFNVRVLLKALLAVTATLACFLGALAVYYHPFTRRLRRKKKHLNATAIGINFREFTFQELHEATDGFTRILGRGASGKVYRGALIIDGAEIGIAVKKLEKKIEKSEREFMTELKIIGRTHHRNLVRLLGFCIDSSHRIIVYEQLEVVVRHDTEVLNDFKKFEEMALVGLWCVHPNPALRPSMKQVMQMLDGTVEVGVPPLVYDMMMADQGL